MKRIIFFIFIFFITNLYSENINYFTKKINQISKKITKVENEYKKYEKKYILITQKIENLKSQKSKSFVVKILNILKLKYYLKKGNKIGYKKYKLKKELNDLKNDYLTYLILILDRYNEQIKNCINKKCSKKDLKKIYIKRKKWAELLKNYKNLFEIEILDIEFLNNYSANGLKDLKKYLEKKYIQFEQRIYMLNEEKNILNILKHHGININNEEIKEINLKIKKLKLYLNKINIKIKYIDKIKISTDTVKKTPN